jgi:hypothetical protein
MLYIGPVSTEVLEAAYAVKGDIRLCCSEGQVGPKAYTGMTLDAFAEARRVWSEKYARKLIAERDHACRDGMHLRNVMFRDKNYFDGFHFHSFNLADAVDTIEAPGHKQVAWQIGPGEDTSKPVINPVRLWYGWVSFPCGLEVTGGTNTGALDVTRINYYRKAMPHAKLRAHNADFMPRKMFRAVQALFDGVNIAPQLGVVQSLFYLTLSATYGYDIGAWIDACLGDKTQLSRWCVGPAQWYHVGHYHFDQITFREEVRTQTVEVLAHFIQELVDG